MFAWGSPCGLRVWDSFTKQIVIQDPSFGATEIAISNSGSYLACSDGAAVRLWDLQRNVQLREGTLPGSVDTRLVAFMPSPPPDEKSLVITPYLGEARAVWNLNDGTIQLVKSHSCKAESLAALAEPPLLIASAESGRVLVFEAPNLRFEHRLEIKRLETDTGLTYLGHWNLAINAEGSKVAVPSRTEDNTIRLWDIPTREVRCSSVILEW